MKKINRLYTNTLSGECVLNSEKIMNMIEIVLIRNMVIYDMNSIRTEITIRHDKNIDHEFLTSLIYRELMVPSTVLSLLLSINSCNGITYIRLTMI